MQFVFPNAITIRLYASSGERLAKAVQTLLMASAAQRVDYPSRFKAQRAKNVLLRTGLERSC